MSRDRHCDESPDHCFEGPLLKRFSDMVSAHPDSIAIHSRDDAWTYACLAQRADWIAQSVVKTEGTATLPIYLLFDNTPDAIASMVACLKLGRPYVPLSSSMPSERLAHIRDNAQGSLFLTETSNLERAASFTQGQIPVLDIENLEQCISPSHPLPVVAPNTPAWILYTSGSTGTPKGVIQTHRNLLHYISIYTEKQALTSHDRVSLLSSYTANIASHDIFSALLNGATLCVYDVSISGLDPLADWIESTGITVFSCVPTLFRRFCREMDRHHAFQGLRFVKLIGEPVYQRDLEAFRERFPATCVFINRLGSSETGTIRWFCANPETMSEEPNVPVGYAVNDNEIMLLDEGGRPVPQGAVGEIVVRSPYLSPGYWRRPDLTAMAYGGDGDTRRFHTGDMGSMLPDGCLVHVGRKDSPTTRQTRAPPTDRRAVDCDNSSHPCCLSTWCPMPLSTWIRFHWHPMARYVVAACHRLAPNVRFLMSPTPHPRRPSSSPLPRCGRISCIWSWSVFATASSSWAGTHCLPRGFSREFASSSRLI